MSTPPPAPPDVHYELMLGLVRAPGTKLDVLETILSETWGAFGFEYQSIRVADEAANARPMYEDIELDLPDYSLHPDFQDAFRELPSWDERCRRIQRGNHARTMTTMDDVVLRDALVGVQELRRQTFREQSVAWGFRAIRHPSEVNLLRDIYGGRYFTIGAYEPRGSRENNFVEELRGEHPKAEDKLLRDAARFLMNLESVAGSAKPAKIQTTFEKSDLFVDISRLDLMRRAVRRFVAYILGYPFGTPTVDEFGMAVAFTSRKSSSALARAVGAAAVSPSTGAILGTGHNDIPRTPRSGPWPDDDLTDVIADEQDPDGDYREHRYAEDVSDRRRFRAFKDLIDRLQTADFLDKSKINDPDRAAQEIFAHETVRGALQFDAIEYSRTIHAEASLIANAASRGVSLTDATLYVTTFPCHECTRLIIQAGIGRVVFVEPYPKSLAAELYPQQIHYEDADVHRSSPHHLQVRYEPFVGIAPGRFNEIFSFEARKATDMGEGNPNLEGKVAAWPPPDGYHPRESVVSIFLSQREAIAAMEDLESLAIRAASERWEEATRLSGTESTEDVETSEP